MPLGSLNSAFRITLQHVSRRPNPILVSKLLQTRQVLVLPPVATALKVKITLKVSRSLLLPISITSPHPLLSRSSSHAPKRHFSIQQHLQHLHTRSHTPPSQLLSHNHHQHQPPRTLSALQFLNSILLRALIWSILMKNGNTPLVHYSVRIAILTLILKSLLPWRIISVVFSKIALNDSRSRPAIMLEPGEHGADSRAAQLLFSSSASYPP